MMIDFHCHLLPGIDDGSQSMDESLELARQSVADGVTHVVVTPHGGMENLEKTLAKRDEKLLELRRRLADENIQLTLIPGLEYSVDGHSDDAALEHPNCRCGDNPSIASPLLVELKFSMNISFAGNLLFKAQLKGIPVILAHAERYEGFRNGCSMLMELMDKGLVIQFNSQNFRRPLPFFNSVPKVMLKLIAHAPENVIVGSDAHNPKMRPAGLEMARNIVTSEFGEDVWRKISWENPAKLLGLQ
ncbi:MAG: hypothetical protein IJS15_04470 [Victivallales bacterium]|nr:hypothetical protein [Victivallales bacterium]